MTRLKIHIHLNVVISSRTRLIQSSLKLQLFQSLHRKKLDDQLHCKAINRLGCIMQPTTLFFL